MKEYPKDEKHGKATFTWREKSGRYRLSFQYVHDDQEPVITEALEKARKESDTEYDAVALTNICLHYLA